MGNFGKIITEIHYPFYVFLGIDGCQPKSKVLIIGLEYANNHGLKHVQWRMPILEFFLEIVFIFRGTIPWNWWYCVWPGDLVAFVTHLQQEGKVQLQVYHLQSSKIFYDIDHSNTSFYWKTVK